VIRAWGRLLRLSLAPSAAADIVAGALLVDAGAAPDARRLAAGIAASLCLYHGGMALNDWADRAHDARTRPSRPIPSGAVSARAALIAGLAGLAAGPSIAAWALGATAGWIAASIAVLVAFYDLAGRAGLVGPLLLAACRAGNLALGAAVVAGARWDEPRFAGVLALYAAYVFAIGGLGRHEDRAALDARAARSWAWAALVPLAALPALVASSNWLSACAVTALCVAALWTPAARLLGPGLTTQGDVIGFMGLLLRRLLIVTAAAAWSTGTPAGWIAGLAILGGYPLSFALRRVFPPS